MALAAAKCTQCGADLRIDDSKEAAVCSFCGSAFVTEKAIRNFNISNPGVVNIYGDLKDFEIHGGELKKYNATSTKVVIPNTVTVIGSRSFQESAGITEVVIPNTVTIIEEWAFHNCKNLVKLTFPDSVEIIEGYAFGGCKRISEIDISDKQWEKFKWNFSGTPFFKKKEPVETEKMLWETRGLCPFCGGKIGGFLTPKCTVCGMEKVT